MKELINLGRVGLLLVLLALALSPVVLAAQEQSGNPSSMTLQDVKDRLKQNQMLLEDAQNRGKAGDAAGLQTALDNFSRSTDGLNRALSSGQFNGTANQQEEALSRVADATSKHTQTLTNLLNKVPPQAQTAIQRAISVSQKGHDTAVANLQGFHAQHPNLGQSGGVSQGQRGDRPAGAGRPAGSPTTRRPSARPGRP